MLYPVRNPKLPHHLKTLKLEKKMIDYHKIQHGIRNIDPLPFVQSLIILEMVALIFSTAATVMVEILIFLCFISFKKLRLRILAEINQPMVRIALVLYAMVSVGVLYSAAPFLESLDMWVSWRKLLLVPLVASVFTDPQWKQRLVYYFIVVIALSALVSFSSHVLDVGIYKFPVGIVVDNHATQGMLFSVAMFASLVLLRFPFSPQFAHPWLLKLSAGLLSLNIILVTPGRSGYLAFIVLITVFIFFGIQKRIKAVLLLVAPLVILALILASPVAKNRVFLGIEEMKTYEQSPELTSMGVRVVMWKNTIALLKRFEHPVFGYGTGGFKTAYIQQVAGEKGWQGKPVGDPHNQYLRIFVEYGFLGLIIFLLFIVSFFRQPVKEPFHIMAIGVLLAWCAISMFSASFTIFAEGRFLMIWCSALLSVSLLEKLP